LDSLDRLLAESSDAAIKLAPATEVPRHWQRSAELQWLESRGECRQQVAWFGNLARNPGRRSATLILPDDRTRTIVGTSDDSPPTTATIGRYLYEPAVAVLAANLTSELCRQHNLAAFGAGIAYLTGDSSIDDLALTAFEILDMLPFDRKQLRAYCRERGIGRLEIKKRGVELDPAKLRQEIIVAGDNSATFLIAPYEQKVRVFCTRRISST
jgi:hypothetical protein